MKLKKIVLATSIALSTMAATGTVQAHALATSVLDLTNFLISRDGTILDVSDFSGISPTNTADISASLNGVATTGSLSGAGEDLDLGMVCQGSGCPGIAPENSYPIITNPAASSFAAADQSQFGSPISGLVGPTGPISTPGSGSHGAYVSLDEEGDGTSTANNGLQSAFTFELGEGGVLDFSFDARAYLEAWSSNDEAFPTAASSAYNLTFTVDDLVSGANVITWAPDGPGGLLGTGIVSEIDPFRLNDAVGRNAPFNGTSFRGASEGVAFVGAWSARTIPLLANNTYQLTIRSAAEADAREVVALPEPATLALMGLGMLGLGLSRRRRD